MKSVSGFDPTNESLSFRIELASVAALITEFRPGLFSGDLIGLAFLNPAGNLGMGSSGGFSET